MGNYIGRLHAWLAGLLLCTFAAGGWADDEVIEDILVVGSHLPQHAKDGPQPVDILDADNTPGLTGHSLIDTVRSLPYTSGNFGQASLRGSATGFSDMNLRGLGAGRTLVLLNGKRFGNELNRLPISIIDRVEVLKGGGSVLYGSDAIAGTVNFATDNDFTGHKLKGTWREIEDSSGDYNLTGLHGLGDDQLHWLFGWQVEQQGEVDLRDRSWGVVPRAENPENGWAPVGNPGSFLPALAPTILAIIGPLRPDPQCALLGSVPEGPICQFQFANFMDLQEKSESIKTFNRLDWQINEHARLYSEVMLTRIRSERAVSPSFPPSLLFQPGFFISPSHPGLQDIKAQNPGLFPDVGPFPSAGQGAFGLFRVLGAGGPVAETDVSDVDFDFRTVRLGVEGEVNGIRYDVSFIRTWTDTVFAGSDTVVERLAFALDGLGGPNCNRNALTPGINGCEYYNPFSNAVATSAITGAANPQFNPAVANSPELLDWLLEYQALRIELGFQNFDLVMSGTSGWQLGGGAVDWAAGLQWRQDKRRFAYSPFRNRTLNPCPYADPLSVTLGNTPSLDCDLPLGPLGFITASENQRFTRDVYAAFIELGLPLSERWEMQVAARYEYYEGDVGGTLDPKLSLRWQALDWLALRASASSSFRAPPETMLGQDTFVVEFVGPANSFKTIDVLANPGLEPEQAWVTNLGVLLQAGRFNASLDWWRVDIDGPLYRSSPAQIAAAYANQGCFDGGAGVGSAACDILRGHIFPLGSSLAALERINVRFVNGTYEITSGVDLSLRFAGLGALGTAWDISLEGTYVDKYRSGDFVEANGLTVAPGGSRVGLLNDGDPFTPKPRVKANLSLSTAFNRHSFTLVGRFISGYDDVRPSVPALGRIDSHLTLDAYYGFTLNDHVQLQLSVINAFDEDPPATSTATAYDALTHSGLGRVISFTTEVRL